MKIHGEKKFACSKCGHKFHRNDSLELHLKTHSNQGKLACAVCDKMLKSKNSLDYHMTLHTGKKTSVMLIVQQTVQQEKPIKVASAEISSNGK